MHSDAVLILILPIRKREKKYHSRVICNTQCLPEKKTLLFEEKKKKSVPNTYIQ